MEVLIFTLIALAVVALMGLPMALKIVKQYEQGVLFRFGRLVGTRAPGLRVIVPFADVLHRVSLRIVTMPIQSQGIITRGNVSVDVSAVAYFRVVDAVKSVIAIENVGAAINQVPMASGPRRNCYTIHRPLQLRQPFCFPQTRPEFDTRAWQHPGT
ncbi:SPFH domain-containing protein [Streptomyces sp. H27-H1]|uniref:SPFH domain-containing protein n=1 Tax=Streptomyces sp. H27-H1 TaxID=2996461 RepID=UPI00227067D6|nr:SPFH domain-containing protein [Streptomyces sp. H27-H1]MCY0928009.1 SPFH domain-containing protein [Streptomyces sp. H27-H1]